MTLKYGNVDIAKLSGKIYKDRLLINYETTNFMIQTDWLKLTHYGIPKSDKFHTNEESRIYLQIPLNDNEVDVTTFDNEKVIEEKKEFLYEKEKQKVG